jgi:hypothetical protein
MLILYNREHHEANHLGFYAYHPMSFLETCPGVGQHIRSVVKPPIAQDLFLMREKQLGSFSST